MDDSGGILNFIRAKRLVEAFEDPLRWLLRERWDLRSDLLQTALPWKDGAECGKILCELCCSRQTRFSISSAMKQIYERGKINEMDVTNLLAAIEAILQDLKSLDSPSLPLAPSTTTTVNNDSSKISPNGLNEQQNLRLKEILKNWDLVGAYIDTIHRVRNEMAHNHMSLDNDAFVGIVDRMEACIPHLALLPQLFQEALDIDLELVHLKAGSGSLVSDGDCLRLKKEGLQKLALRQFDSCVQCFEDALMAPNVSNLDAAFLHMYAGEALLELKREEEALEKAKLACMMVPSLWRSHSLLAKCYIRCYKFDKAAKSIKKCQECPIPLKKNQIEIESVLSMVKHRIELENALKMVGSRDMLPCNNLHTILKQAQTMEFPTEAKTQPNYFDALQRYIKLSHSGSAIGSFKAAYIMIRKLADVPKETRKHCIEYLERGSAISFIDDPLKRSINPTHPSSNSLIGVSECLYLIGELYDRGLYGKTRDSEKARYYYNLAVKQGFTLAKDLIP